MDIIRLPIIKGITPTLLNGTNRYAYGLSDFTDSWELKDWQEHGGYQMPLFSDGMIYFLQVDYDDKKVNLYRVSSSFVLEKITDLSIDEVNLYNIGLTGEGVYITSQDESFVCYYPEAFEIKLEANESVLCIDGDRIYVSAWIEEGVENEEITKDYSYYEKVRVKDKAGNLISEEIGSLTQFPDGKWRIS